MGNVCGTIYSDPGKEPEINVEKIAKEVIERVGNNRSIDLEEKFTLLLNDIECPNESVKVRVELMSIGEMERIITF